jgi:hypothetical protein
MNDYGRQWSSLVARLKSEASTTLKRVGRDRCEVIAYPVVNYSGTPIVWVVMQGKFTLDTGEEKEWSGLVDRVRDESRNVLHNNKNKGLMIVPVRVVVDASGSLLIWEIKSGLRIEPAKDAMSVIQGLAQFL